MSITFECLDLANDTEIANYERAFYGAFVRVQGNRLIRTLWQWNDAQRRLATRIEYTDQLIFVGRDGAGRIEMAIATNIACRQWQSAAFGFHGPMAGGTCCEFLTFFTVSEFRLSFKRRFHRAFFAELRQRGLRTAYATTAPRLLRAYQRIGGVLVDQKEIAGEMRYFLEFALERS